MSKSLSWKILLPIGLVVWLLGKYMDSVVGGVLALIGIIMLLIGIIDLIRFFIKKNKAQ